MESFLVISFESTHDAMQMEKRLKKKFQLEMIPTPRSITASCGLSLKINLGLWEDVIKTLESSGLDSDMFRIYRFQKNGQRDKVIPIEWQKPNESNDKN